jgi:hypothetical protein
VVGLPVRIPTFTPPPLSSGLSSQQLMLPPKQMHQHPPPLFPAGAVAVAVAVQVNSDGVFRYAYVPWFSQALQVLALSGVHGVAVDVWVSGPAYPKGGGQSCVAAVHVCKQLVERVAAVWVCGRTYQGMCESEVGAMCHALPHIRSAVVRQQ